MQVTMAPRSAQGQGNACHKKDVSRKHLYKTNFFFLKMDDCSRKSLTACMRKMPIDERKKSLDAI
jgi:hypothetical protein